MKLLILKLVVFLLALVGLHLPTPYVYVCAAGRSPAVSAPSSCEVVKI